MKEAQREGGSNPPSFFQDIMLRGHDVGYMERVAYPSFHAFHNEFSLWRQNSVAFLVRISYEGRAPFVEQSGACFLGSDDHCASNENL